MRQNVVFVVDDDASVRKGLERILVALGYAVVTCEDGDAFLAAVDDEAPACALIDMCLPGMTGLDVIAALHDRRIDIPVVCMTGHPEIPTCVRAMKEGVVDFLQKPLRKDDLVSAIRSAHLLSINRRHARSESRRAEQLLARLTVREREVLALVLDGRRNKEIAARLDSQEATVKVHRSRLMRKLGVRSVPDLVRIGNSGNLAALLLRDRNAPLDDMPRATARGESVHHRAAVTHADDGNGWLAADGTWSGFTWTSQSAAPRHHQ